MKLCKACNGPVCPYCGGCISEGECVCDTPEITALKAQLKRVQRTSLERLFLLWSVQASAENPVSTYQEICESIRTDLKADRERLKADQDDMHAINDYLREHGYDPDKVGTEIEQMAKAHLLLAEREKQPDSTQKPIDF